MNYMVKIVQIWSIEKIAHLDTSHMLWGEKNPMKNG